MKLKPLYDCVVVRRLEAETTSQGGIIIAGLLFGLLFAGGGFFVLSETA